MKLTCNSTGQALLVDIDPAVVPEFRRWFALRRTKHPTIWGVPDDKVRAMIMWCAGGGQLEVSPELQRRLNDTFTRDAVRSRVRPELKHYRGGYQADIVSKAVSDRRHALFTDMGSGKSMMALETARLTGPTVLFCPPGAWFNAYANRAKAGDGLPKGDLLRWYSEGENRLQYGTWMGSSKKDERLGLFRLARDLYAVSPFLAGGILDELLALPLATMIWDESSLMRSSESQMFQVAKQLAAQIPNRYVMSGYPYPKNIGNLWTQMHIVDPSILGTEAEFIAEYATKKRKTAAKSEFGDREKNERLIARLGRSGLVTCMSQEEFWPERPEFHRKRVKVTLSVREREEYDRANKLLEIQHGAETLKIAGDRNTKITKLRELTSGFVYRDRRDRRNGGGKLAQIVKRPAKMTALKKLLLTHCRGEQVVVWYYFKPEVEMIQEVVREVVGERFAFYQGTSREAILALHRFATGDAKILITHPQSAGHGIRLTEARHMIFVSSDWNNDFHEQAVKRVFRPPQRRDVYCWYLTAENTKDEEVLSELQARRNDRSGWDALLRKYRMPLSPIVPHTETIDDRRQRTRKRITAVDSARPQRRPEARTGNRRRRRRRTGEARH